MEFTQGVADVGFRWGGEFDAQTTEHEIGGEHDVVCVCSLLVVEVTGNARKGLNLRGRELPREAAWAVFVLHSRERVRES